jgi:hypothetical protein
MKHIKIYESFLSENDGFGRDYFVKKKDGKSIRYFFKIEGEEDTLCFIVSIGKSSRKTTIESAENSYAVLSVEPISQGVMDDYLVNETDYKSRTKDEIILTKSELMRFYFIVSECLKDYLENSPKVSMIYDEMLLNLTTETEDYLSSVGNLMEEWSYGKWGIQEGTYDRTIIYMKRDHE